LILGPGARVMSLRDGTKKMSKSDPSDYSRINLTDDPDTIALKLRKARTDPAALQRRPEADNLAGIYASLAGVTKAQVLQQFGGAQFSAFKPALAELVVEKLRPVSTEINRLRADPSYIDSVLADGAERARTIAGPVVRSAKEIVGLSGR